MFITRFYFILVVFRSIILNSNLLYYFILLCCAPQRGPVGIWWGGSPPPSPGEKAKRPMGTTVFPPSPPSPAGILLGEKGKMAYFQTGVIPYVASKDRIETLFFR